MLPVAMSTAVTIQRCSALDAGLSPPKYKPLVGFSVSMALTTLVTKTRSPATIGDDQPVPGTATRQAMFSVLLQCSGRLAPSAIPRPPGPRNCGHGDGVACTER